MDNDRYRRAYKAWSEYDDITLLDLRKQKIRIRVIAGVMKRTESSIHNRISILKLAKKKKIRWIDRLAFWR